MPRVRIQKYLSECGVASRRKAEDLIKEGKVRVNGKTITELGSKIDPAVDTIYVKNKPIKVPHKGIILFNKPKDVVSTLSDPEGRPCINDYLTKNYKSYYPVGRLDWETSGLLVLTNDGEVAENLMHPRYGWERVYHARVEGSFSEDNFRKMESGVKLSDGMIQARGKIISQDEKSTWIEIIVVEGRNRVVRRLMDKLRHPVMKLKRVAYGPFRVGKLKPGEIMKLTQKEYSYFREKILKSKKSSK